MRRSVAFLVTVAVALLGSCSSGSGKKAASTPKSSTTTTTTASTGPTTSAGGSTTAPATTATTTTATTTTACPLAGTTSPQGNGLAPATMLLTAVNATADGCLARLKWVFRSTGAAAAPGYRVEYKAGPFAEDGSGAPVTVKGSYFLVVRFEPAAGADLEHGGASTYSGPKSILTNGVPHVLELRETGDFEGVVTWVVGLDAVRPVEATTSAQPPTLTLTLH
ncbi:MAG: hypothetical protein U0V73_06765 [Acidimicrobiia bacterium]